MLRISFLVLWIILAPKAQAQTPIEIYADGHKYDSLQAYQASKFNKVKTVQVNTSALSDTTRHKLYVVSIEQGMSSALQDFYQTWSQPAFALTDRISPYQLQDAIQQSVTSSKDPKLLISEPGKVRIMSLNGGDSPK